ncbi:MAG TPA: CRTAC1 family protein [Phycisphaerales bacterium]|nr:CRTAC1 family protein [Phycisphaerales bacterium]
MTKLATIGAIVVATLLSGANAGAQTALFSDQTAAAGLIAVHTTAPLVDQSLPVMTGGVAVGDFNNDGWQDVFVLGGPGAPDKLFINNHNGTFTDRAPEWGVARTHWGYGIAVGDYDNDGRLDMFITSGGADGTQCRHLLYHNNANGTFSEGALDAGVQWTTELGYDGFGAAWGDYDLDGRLDLAVTGWRMNYGGNRLYHNNGDGTFSDATAALGTSMLGVEGFSPRFVDMNGDRYPELLWVADFQSTRYFVNNTDGTFTDTTAASGVGLEGNGMGSTIGDFNNDGRPDWYVTAIYLPNPPTGVPWTGNHLYINNGSHQYTEVGAPMGVRQGGWGWGTVAVDTRNIGRQDLIATNGWPQELLGPQWLQDPTRVFANSGAASFADEAPGCGITHTGQGRGMVNFDYNNDGAQDIIIATNAGPLTLYRNERTGPGANYLRVFLTTLATPSRNLAPNGYGAHVVATAGDAIQHRWICGGSNYLSQSELSAHFGLGTAPTVSRLRVEWPDGTVTLRSNLPANQTLTISSCGPDWNGDGTLGVQDIFDFLNAWFAGGGDYNASGTTAIEDIFDFLNAWFAGCS